MSEPALPAADYAKHAEDNLAAAAAGTPAVQVDRRTHRPLSAIGFVLLAVFCFAVLDTTTKTVIGGVPLLMAIWVRYAIQAVVSTAILWPAQGNSLWQTRHLGLQAVRGVLLLGSSLFAFTSLMVVPVGEFSAIVMTTPLVMTLIASRFMNEHVSALRWLFVAGGFFGVLMIIHPGGSTFQWVWLLPLVVVAFNTGFQLLTSRMARTENPSTTHFYTGWVGTGLATVALPFVWTTVTDTSVWLRMLLMGFAGAIGHFCLTVAYTRAPAAALTPYLYAHIGAAMLLGWWVMRHVPDQWALTGMLVIAVCGGGGAWLSAREARPLT